MKPTAYDYLRDIMAAHFDAACHTRKRKPDIWNPKKEDVD